MQRAAELTSVETRRKLADAVEGLIRLAEHPQPMPPSVRFPRTPVLHERAALVDLADRLRAPAPVSVVGVALVAEFVWSGSSPLRAVGEGADEAVRAAIDRCWQVLAPASPFGSEKV